MYQGPYKIFIGYDSREDIAYQVAKYSIESHCPRKHLLDIIPLNIHQLRDQKLYTRPDDPLSSTEFTFTRFLIPELMDYTGWALFLDCDFLFKADITNIFNYFDQSKAVLCVQHNYNPKNNIKMDGKIQSIYPRKNWSSLVLWNCEHPDNRKVTKDLVNTATGQYLHRFQWLADDKIGKIPKEWNWLVDWYKEPTDGYPCALHYTEGGPWFEAHEKCGYALDWLLEEKKYLNNERKKNKIFPKLNWLEDLPIDRQELVKGILNYAVDPNNYYLDCNLEKIKDMVFSMGNKVAAISSEGGINYGNKGLPYDGLLISFILGTGGYISDYDKEQNTTIPLVIRGLGGGSRKALQLCSAKNRDFYAIDTGYFGNDKHKRLHRITKNELQITSEIKEHELDRAKRFGYKYKKQTKGRKILICPPSVKVMDYFHQPTPEVWVENVIQQLKQFTDRPIEIRLKPIRSERVSTKTIQQALGENVHCLVTYNSIAAIEAMMEGKPAIALGPSAAQVICETSLAKIENPKFPTRQEMDAFMAHLSYNMFTEIEMRSGFAWKQLYENSQLPQWHPKKK